MTKKPAGQRPPKQPCKTSPEVLRQRAEALASSARAADPESFTRLTPAARLDLLHELQVHEIELELQNVELRQTSDALHALRSRYFDLYNLAPVGYITVNERGLILQTNLAAATLLGLNRQSLLKQPLSRFLLPEDCDRYYLHLKRVLSTAIAQVIELRLKRPEGEPCWVQLESNHSQDVDGNTEIRAVLTDINDRKRNEITLRQAAVLFENAREGVIVADASKRIVAVNAAFLQLTGFSAAEVKGQLPSLLQSGRHDKPFYAAMWTAIESSGYWQGEMWNRHKNGEICPHLVGISVVRDETGHVSHYVGVYSDLTHIRDAAARLEFLAHHDPLTGLPNRLLLFDRLQHFLELASREPKSLALLMLDLDRFKDVNDSFGHLAGDELLQQVAQRLTSRLRGIDTVTRLGGDEFAVLLEDVQQPQDAALVAGQIIEVLAEPWQLSNSVEVHVGVSIGISLFPENGRTSEELMQQADAALYRAKAEGRGNFKYFSDDLTHAAVRRISLESLLRRAIGRDELRLHFQPLVDIASARVIGAEALVRWQHPSDGLILPGQFIAVAEETGLIGAIGEWVLQETCRQGQRWIAAGLPDLMLAVNVSSHQFRHGSICGTVAKALTDTGFPAARLELELTESALMEREDDAVILLTQLRALGVHLAIDDFGTGYSSLAKLKRFPLDVVKIDKSFIDDIPQLEDDMEIAAAIVAMSHILRLKVVAEGVENAEQLAFLTAKGCDAYQGHYFSPAVTPEAFALKLQ